VVEAIAKVAEQLDDGYVVVRPDRLSGLFAQAVKSGQAPAGTPQLVVPGEAEEQVTLKRVADGSIKVDGDGNDWRKLPAMRAYVTRDGKMVAGANKPAAGDLAAEVAAVVDSRFLYVLADVSDKNVIVDDVNLTAGDHVEIYLDTRKGHFREPEMTEGFYRLALVPAAGLVKNPQLVLQYPPYDIGLASMNKHGIQEELSSVASRGGYLVEAAIPLVNFPGCTWKPGDQLAMGFAVRNLDARRPAPDASAVAASIDPLICRPAVVD
jgi:hypothetical protein